MIILVKIRLWGFTVISLIQNSISTIDIELKLLAVQEKDIIS